MLSVIASHCYNCNMWFILVKNAEGNALEPCPQMILTDHGHHSPVDLHGLFGCRSREQKGLRRRGVVWGRSTSCVCWKEEEWVECLPSTPSKNPDKKNPPHKNRVGERSRVVKFNKAEVWGEEADEDMEGSWREEPKHLDQYSWTSTQPMWRLMLLKWEVKVKLW